MTDGILFNHIGVHKDHNGLYEMDEEMHHKFSTVEDKAKTWCLFIPGYMKEFAVYIAIFHNEKNHNKMIYRFPDQQFDSDFHQPALIEGHFTIDSLDVGIIQYRLKQASYFKNPPNFADE